MTARLMRNGRIAMDRQAVAEVVRIIEQAERRFSPAFPLTVDPEPAFGCVSQAAHALLLVMLTAAGRYWKHHRHGTIVVYQQQHLPIEVNFDVLIPCIFRPWRCGAADGVQLCARKTSSNSPAFPFLKRSERQLRGAINHAVKGSSPVAHF